MTCVAADIGGTHSRLALVGAGDDQVFKYRNSEFADFYQVIDRFTEQSGCRGDTISRSVIALPGPVENPPVRLTNIDWEVDPDRLQLHLPSRETRLLNDFQAAAVGALAYGRRRALNPGAVAGERGAAVITGAGTGLGMAWVADIAAAELPRATEGGHADFAPADAQQRELLAWLQQRHGGHVSWERLLSGGGLSAIHQFLSGATQALPAAAVDLAAQAGDAVALATLRLFVRLFGAYAGNLALLFNPSAGIFLCGGVVGHLADRFDDTFLDTFLDKGRMRRKVEKIPVYLVDDADIGLHGAIKIAKDEFPT